MNSPRPTNIMAYTSSQTIRWWHVNGLQEPSKFSSPAISVRPLIAFARCACAHTTSRCFYLISIRQLAVAIASVQETRFRQMGIGAAATGRWQCSGQTSVRSEDHNQNTFGSIGEPFVTVGKVCCSAAEGGESGNQLQAIRLQSTSE